MPNFFHLQGVEAYKQQKYQVAKTLLLHAIDENPEEAESYLFLSRAYFFEDEKIEAIAHLKKYIELNQQSPEEIVNVSNAFDLLGQCYEANNKNHEAITAYTTATKINPLAASAWHNLGLLYLKSAQYYLEPDLTNSLKLFHKAQILLKNALEICSTNPMLLHSVASWYEQYIEALEKEVTEDSEAVQKNIDNHFKLAIHYYQKALITCHEDDVALKNIVTSNLTECLAQYGHHLYRAEDYVNALALYSQAIALDPNHLGVMNQIGMSFFKQNLFPDARKHFSDILDKTSDAQEIADAYLNIACTYRCEKSWENAENALNKAKEFAPEDPAIFDEERQLMDAQSQTLLIAAPQVLFRNPNYPASQSQLSLLEEKPFFG